jgi:hypothetical protein
VYIANPTSSFGYYRGSPNVGGGSLSGMGGSGPMAQGIGQFAQGQGPVQGVGGWDPTILYIFVLIIAEMIVFGFLARHI